MKKFPTSASGTGAWEDFKLHPADSGLINARRLQPGDGGIGGGGSGFVPRSDGTGPGAGGGAIGPGGSGMGGGGNLGGGNVGPGTPGSKPFHRPSGKYHDSLKNHHNDPTPRSRPRLALAVCQDDILLFCSEYVSSSNQMLCLFQNFGDLTNSCQSTLQSSLRSMSDGM